MPIKKKSHSLLLFFSWGADSTFWEHDGLRDSPPSEPWTYQDCLRSQLHQQWVTWLPEYRCVGVGVWGGGGEGGCVWVGCVGVLMGVLSHFKLLFCESLQQLQQSELRMDALQVSDHVHMHCVHTVGFCMSSYSSGSLNALSLPSSIPT